MIASTQLNPDIAPYPTTSPRCIQIACDENGDEAIYVNDGLRKEFAEYGEAYACDIAEASGGEVCRITFHRVFGTYSTDDGPQWPESFAELTQEA